MFCVLCFFGGESGVGPGARCFMGKCSEATFLFYLSFATGGFFFALHIRTFRIWCLTAMTGVFFGILFSV